MARYAKIDRRIRTDAKVRALSPIPPCGQGLWFLLLCNEHMGPIPGLYCAGEKMLAEAFGWTMEGFRKAFAEVYREGLAKADWDARLIWLPSALKYNSPQSPNVVKSWVAAWDELPECALKDEASRAVVAFLEALPKGFIEAFGKVCPNQDQDQDQDLPPTPQGGESAPSDASSRARDSDTQIAEVWAYYCRVMERERVRKAVPGPVVRKLKARLVEGVTVEEVRAAIRGCRRSPYHRGDNDTRTVYDSLALIARSADKVREFAGREEATRALHAEGKVHLSGGRWVYESRERGPIDLGPKREVWDGNGAIPPAGSDPGAEPAPEVLGPGHTRLPYQ